ncbi:MAG: TonB-dependent receptor, partial [Caulobacteraceae bacterium]
MNAARATIQPQIGASVYTIDRKAIEALPGGANTGLNQVVLQAPGVAQDSFGQLHVRGEHNGLQYRLDGVILPEGLSVFGQALNPRLADKVQLITGALPAQYGLRTAGIIDIATKSGEFANGGDVSIYGGSHNEIEPSIEYGGSAGRFDYFASVSYLHDDLGVESPNGQSDPLHDATDQFNAFAYLADIIDPSSRVALILGASNQRFQIPDRAGLTPSLMFGPNGDQPLVVDGQTTFDSATLNESQKEATYYAVASYLRDEGSLTTQVSLFGRYSTLKFSPDPLGDLLFDGIAQGAYKRDVAGGMQAEAAWRAGAGHTVRGGVIAEIDRSTSDSTSQVIALDPATGSQVSDQPVTIVDNSAQTSKSLSLYLQDEWELLETLTLNYGLRFDQFDGFRNENQLSPRVNAVWKATPTTTVHAGYARYFSPPPFELVAAPTVAKFANTTAASSVTLDTTPYAERA